LIFPDKAGEAQPGCDGRTGTEHRYCPPASEEEEGGQEEESGISQLFSDELDESSSASLTDSSAAED
jgi:hypothetical protein